MKSIRSALAVHLPIYLFFLVAAFGLFLYFGFRSVIVREFDTATLAKARALAGLVEEEDDGELEFEFSDESMPEFSREHDPEYFQFRTIDSAARIIARSRSLGIKDLPVYFAAPRDPFFNDITLSDGRRGRFAALRFSPQVENDRDSNRPLPPDLAVVVARSREPLDATLRRLAVAIALSCLLLPLLIAAAVWLAVNRGLHPLQAVAAAAAAIDDRSLDQRFPAAGLPAELQPICARLNDLMTRIEKAFDRERRFSRDVAHELRTPIAELRAISEVALMESPGGPQSGVLRETLAISQQMEQLVATLQALVRHEAGVNGLPLEPVDLGAALNEIVGEIRDPAHVGRIEIETPRDRLPTVQTNRPMLLMVLRNLVANALDYSPATAAVTVRVEQHDGIRNLIISNPAADLVPADLPHLFEPFWRKDPARSDNKHSGLGLALVASVCRVLGISIECRLENRLFQIQLTLPELAK